MEAPVVFGLVLAVVLVIWFVLSRRASERRALRAKHAHSEPGGPRGKRDPGAEGMAAAKLADTKRDEWSG